MPGDAKKISSNRIQNWKKTDEIGQSCVQFYKTKTPHVTERHSMHEISKVSCQMH